MTQFELINYLSGLRGATFATIQTLVEPTIKSPKTSGMEGRIKKRSRINVTLNHVYGNSVNRQRNREGKTADFIPKPRKWGQRIVGTTLVEHNGKHYVEVKIERVFSTEYLLDGHVVPEKQIKQYLKPKKEYPSRQGVNKPTILQDYGIDKIEAIHINGQQIKVEN